MPLTLYCATANPGKLVEFQQGAPPDLRLVPSPPFDCAETGQSFQENAIHKA